MCLHHGVLWHALQFSELDEACCEALKALLPQLHELNLNRCEVHGACLPVLVPELQLRRLKLTSNSFHGVSASETVAGLAIFKNMETLDIGTFEIEKLPIFQLTGLQQLKSLVLSHCFPVGIDVLLQAVPLQNLKLVQEFILPSGIQFTSTSLRTLCIDTLSPSVCSAFVSNGLPNLQYLQTRALDVSYASSDRIEGMVSRLAEFPLVLCGYGKPHKKLELYGCTSWSFDRSVSVLQTVSRTPIFKILSTELVLYFNSLHWNLHNPGILGVISKLFPRHDIFK
ncbi:hypothetical protein DUNSADRAFT_8833 [Dunaliella salina]|uniref:Encoded protein n=1 Tax=Dunaliella salina TaxID=3046 RepID=A0ABQ7GIN8_DUNSA|nr:hypothetical protein DUNSADRAFT_8833 [Dunaliella salina]|eukprot:KAF5834477.1 hypothetical protein DUNSADRAFT_8833 [Dunaliella salina]